MALSLVQVPCPAPADLVPVLLACEKKIFGKAGAWEAPELTKELSKRTTLLFVVWAPSHQQQVNQAGTAVDAPASKHHQNKTKQEAGGRVGNKQTARKQTSVAPKTSTGSRPPGNAMPTASLTSIAQQTAGTGKQVAGYIFATATSINVHIVKVAVQAEYRRQGLGTALVQAVLQAAVSQRRCSSASLYVAVDNKPAQALYALAGFQEDGQLTDYYAPGKHALRLCVDDIRMSPQLAAFLSRRPEKTTCSNLASSVEKETSTLPVVGIAAC